MKVLFLITLIAASTGPSLAQADCLDTYHKMVDELKVERDRHLGAIDEQPTWSKRDGFAHAQMINFWDVVTSLGIPNVTGTTQYSLAASAYNEAYAVYGILKDAQIGGGINLIHFVNDIRSEKKSLSSIDVESVASAIRDASAKNYFCGSKLANYSDAKEIVMNMVSP